MSGNENTHGAGTGDAHGNGHGDAHGEAAWGWQPVPHGGEYDSDATAFVKLPPEMLGGVGTGEPLAAPGHGYVPPVIVPVVTSAASTDPAATGTWTLPVGDPVQWPAAAAADPAPGDGTDRDPGATAEWHFAEASAPDQAHTGEWSVPVADGDLPEESGEYARTSLSPEWARQAPATLPGGAPAPWAAALAAEAEADAPPAPAGQAHADSFGTDAYAAQPPADGEDAYGHPAPQEFDGVRGYVAPPADYTGTAVRLPAEPAGYPASGPPADTYPTGTFAGLAAEALGTAGHTPPAGHPQEGHLQEGHLQEGHLQEGRDTAAGHPAPQAAPFAAAASYPAESRPVAEAYPAEPRLAAESYPDGSRPAADSYPAGSHPGAESYPAEPRPAESYPAAASYPAPESYPAEPFAAPAGPDPYSAPAPESAPAAATRPEAEHLRAEHLPHPSEAHELPGAGAGADIAVEVEPAQAQALGQDFGASPAPAGEPAEPGGTRVEGHAAVPADGALPGEPIADEPEPVAQPAGEPVAAAGAAGAVAVPGAAHEADAPLDPAGAPVPAAGAEAADVVAETTGTTGATGTDDAADAVPGAGEADAAPEPRPAADGHGEHPYASYVLRVNGADRPVTAAWIGESLLYVLRERLGLAGAKDGCSQGECGACAVQVDGRLVASCLVPAATAAGSEVRTVEGLATDGELSDVQRALCGSGAVQCGFCVPGMAMTIHDLLEGNHAPSELETRQALCGNLCRCSGYRGVLEAVREVVAGREAAHAAEHPDGESAAASASAFGAPELAPEYAPEARIPHQAPPGAGGVHREHGHEHEHDHGGMGGMA
ncbi:2Fe-2S iron-sulfur cluster-binding protein [Streptomyces sp. NBC_00239]|uniref:2Fe-2S iron-sulfur cluster-binding protein n=1 Tax=Streptomyces sp. NBC_00239 TaxID=2903640 RepID=UPI002E293C4E|nr:2Fe-2S iron-sulfur cluster-binding protein [Streptomyces sp. NBC_00239]